MQLVILQQKINKIGSSDLIRSVPHLHDPSQSRTRSPMFLLHKTHELSNVSLLSFHPQELSQSLETEELVLCLSEGAVDQEELKGTAAVHPLRLSFQFGKRKLRVSQQTLQQLHILPHCRDTPSYHGGDRLPMRMLLYKKR